MSGWLKLHRELMHKAIWKTSTPEQKTILITLLMIANHKETEWEWKGERFIVKPGQMITSLKSLVEECGNGITTKIVRNALEKFEKYDFLASETANNGRLITILNWELYQSAGENGASKRANEGQAEGKRGANEGQAEGKRGATNKNDKNNNNINNIYTRAHAHAREGDFENDPDTGKGESKSEKAEILFEDLWQLYPEKAGKSKVSKKSKAALLKIGFDKMRDAIDRYKAKVSTERARGFDLRFQNGSTFFNGGYLDYLEDTSRGVLPFEPAKEAVREDYDVGFVTGEDFRDRFDREVKEKQRKMVEQGIDPKDVPFEMW